MLFRSFPAVVFLLFFFSSFRKWTKYEKLVLIYCQSFSIDVTVAFFLLVFGNFAMRMV